MLPAAERRAGGGGGACPLWTWRPSAAAACDPEVKIAAAARRGYSGSPRCGEKHRGATLEAQPSAVGVALWRKERGGEGAPQRRKCPGRGSIWMGARRHQPGVVSGGWRGGGGGGGLASSPRGCAGPTLIALPWSAGRSHLGRFGDLRSLGPA